MCDDVYPATTMLSFGSLCIGRMLSLHLQRSPLQVVADIKGKLPDLFKPLYIKLFRDKVDLLTVCKDLDFESVAVKSGTSDDLLRTTVRMIWTREHVDTLPTLVFLHLNLDTVAASVSPAILRAVSSLYVNVPDSAEEQQSAADDARRLSRALLANVSALEEGGQ